MTENTSLRNEIRNAVMNYEFCISNNTWNNSNDIIKRKVIGYAVVQFNYSLVQPDDSAKYIQTIPMFENPLLDDYIDYDINLPDCATLINVLPVNNHTVGIFGAIPDGDTTLEDVKKDRVSCKKYTFLGIETDEKNRNIDEYKSKLWNIWINAIWDTALLNEHK